MEIEMKLAIKEKAEADLIWEHDYLREIGDVDSRETVYMKAAYFDTEDYILSKHDIAFRVRMEGNRVVASLKWNGSSQEGLHIREEVNVPIDDLACFLQPSADIFIESEAGRDLMPMIEDKILHSLLEIHFLRRRLRIDTGRSILEVAIDTGDIISGFGNLPICELEIELFSGEQEDVLAIGQVLIDKFNLVPLNESKYSRGLKLITSKE